MITFITSIRHPNNANDYNRVWELLRYTLYSVSCQINKNFRVIVVANAIPDDFSSDPDIINTECVNVEFPPPIDFRSLNDRHTDKSLKYIIGTIRAQKYNPDYIMFFDADDYIHRELTSYVLENRNPHGYIITKGYRLKSNIIKKQDNFNTKCGTSSIISNRLLLSELNIDNLSIESTQQEILQNNPDHVLKIITSHRLVNVHYSRKNCKLDPIPFEAAVYHLCTGENSSRKNFRHGTEITEKLMNQFNIRR